MVSLISELTDAKGRRARAGWVFYDAQCPFCVRTAKMLTGVIGPRGFGLAALQDPRAQSLVNVPPEELLNEMRLVTADGEQFGGADALVRLCRSVWWARPIGWLAQLPWVMRFLRDRYRSFAARRSCAAIQCARSSTEK